MYGVILMLDILLYYQKEIRERFLALPVYFSLIFVYFSAFPSVLPQILNVDTGLRVLLPNR